MNVFGMLLFVLALALSFLCVVARPDSWEEVWFICIFTILVVGPLWATTVLISRDRSYSIHKQKATIIVSVLVFLLTTSVLCAWQVLVAHVRFTIPRSSLTNNAIKITLCRIQAYVKEHRQAPHSLSDLAVDEGFPQRIVDGWQNDLQYSVDQNGIITLTSFGADGKPGGIDKDKDIVVHYRTRKADGSLSIDDE